MRNRWEQPVDGFPSLAEECAYASRLLGAEPTLVLHGGGNTSVKTTVTDVTGVSVDVVNVKGSGWDLAGMQPAGLVALRLSRLRELLDLDELDDTTMANELRCARLLATAPDPSVETLLHALIPHAAVQHSHADAVLALTNLRDRDQVLHEVYGDRGVVVVPYRMPGFVLARLAAEIWRAQAGASTIGLVLLNHGLVTFGDTSREAYDRHIALVSLAEDYLDAHPAKPSPARELPAVAPTELARLRRDVSQLAGTPMVMSRHTDARTAAFVSRADLDSVSQRGPLTPDHVLRTKRVPMVGRDTAAYAAAYRAYFAEHEARSSERLVMLDPAPRVVLDPELGMLTTGTRAADADAAAEIYAHTMDVVTRSESLGGYQALSAADVFDVEYWELEQAKLRRAGPRPELAGEVALVTGAASGIGRACAAELLDNGAAVIGLDLTPSVCAAFDDPAWLGQRVDVTDSTAVQRALQVGVERFGGLDVVVPAAGVLPSSQVIADLSLETWRKVMAVNADAIVDLLHHVYPLLALSPRGGRVVVVGSKNYAAPGPGAVAYSASKAAVTQLARVAAMEWADSGIRVNTVHPDAVFDTGLWTEEILKERAANYGLTVAQYKTRNLLHTEVTSRHVARLIVQMCSDLFSRTTGAQVPVDGGNDRVI